VVELLTHFGEQIGTGEGEEVLGVEFSPVGLCHVVVSQVQELGGVQREGQFDPVVLLEAHSLAQPPEILFVYFKVEEWRKLSDSPFKLVLKSDVVFFCNLTHMFALLDFVLGGENVLAITVLGKLDVKIAILLDVHILRLVQFVHSFPQVGMHGYGQFVVLHSFVQLDVVEVLGEVCEARTEGERTLDHPGTGAGLEADVGVGGHEFLAVQPVEELQADHEVSAFAEVCEIQLHLAPLQLPNLLILLVVSGVNLVEGGLLPVAHKNEFEEWCLFIRVEHAFDGAICHVRPAGISAFDVLVEVHRFPEWVFGLKHFVLDQTNFEVLLLGLNLLYLLTHSFDVLLQLCHHYIILIAHRLS